MTPRLSDHARARCAEMGVPTKQVKRALRDGVGLEYRGSPRYPGGRRVVVVGALAIVVEDDVVVTVLWHGEEGR